MTTDPQTRPPDPPPSSGVLRFALTAGAWFIGLFGLMRLGWVERQILLPFAQLQERVADQLTGVQTDAVYVDASCSGGDAMALCLGAVLAFPATWSARLRGAGIGLLVIAAFNIVRIGNLSLVAAYPSLLDLLHIYVWPAILILVAVAYVYAWMRRQMGPAVHGAGSDPGAAWHGPARRFLLLTVVGTAAYFAAAGWVYESALLHTLGVWVADDQRRHPGGPWGVSHGLREHRHDDARRVHCDPGVYCHPPDSGLRGRRPGGAPRAVAARGGPGGGTGDLLPLGRRPAPGARAPDDAGRLAHRGHPCLLPGAGRGPPRGRAGGAVRPIGRPPAPRAAGCGGDRCRDRRGAGRWVPSGAASCTRRWTGGSCLSSTAAIGWSTIRKGRLRSSRHSSSACAPRSGRPSAARGPWRRLVLGVVGLAGLQLTVLLVLGELSHHLGFAPHVSLIRAWGVVAPLAVVWVLRRPRLTVSPPVPVPVHPLPQPG